MPQEGVAEFIDQRYAVGGDFRAVGLVDAHISGGLKLVGRPIVDQPVACQHIAPEMHFHGHMHDKYDWMNLRNTIVGAKHIQTYGLECNGRFWKWGILDTDAEEFTFAPNIVPTKQIEAEQILEVDANF